ncbi:MAG: PAS domain-containing protein [Halanaerobiales bacterium]|nr:PAS domain-containing protein [Halanaerobiales bacterium]
MSVISIIKTNCKDCYKCVRSCPVKAIKITDGRAQIVEERCINDGNCIHVCPQNAKQVRKTDLELVRQWLKSGVKIAVSLAPSYPVALDIEEADVIPILKKMGFAYIQETAWAAEYVAQEHLKLLNTFQNLPLITSSCPVVIDLIEKYYPALIKYLAPILSPMALHGKILKERFERVVFIGPCIAKKEEMTHVGVRGSIDAVLTFVELVELINDVEITSDGTDYQMFDGEQAEVARLFPLGGGLLKTAELSTDLLTDQFLTVTGLEEIIEMLDDFSEWEGLQMIEMLACNGGCINGVGAQTSLNLIQRRQKLLKIQPKKKENYQLKPLNQSVKREFFSKAGMGLMPSEEEIRNILLQIGKSSPEDELNCGCCGYNSCREKAIAVYNGLAELEMCLPYMRSRAESMSNLIIHSTPNGVFVVDFEMNIIEVNPSAERMFQISNQKVKGCQLSTILADTNFKKVAEEKRLISDLVRYSDSLIVRQYIFSVDKNDLIIGIFYDVTREELQKQELDQMKEETFKKAQDVINKQMRVAQEIAGLLGETTAETKVTLTNLMGLMEKK